MKTVLLSTVAAAALALAGVASAQNLPSEKSAAHERAPAAQQHAPAEKIPSGGVGLHGLGWGALQHAVTTSNPWGDGANWMI